MMLQESDFETRVNDHDLSFLISFPLLGFEQSVKHELQEAVDA
jgi:hypothetical protein